MNIDDITAARCADGLEIPAGTIRRWSAEGRIAAPIRVQNPADLVLAILGLVLASLLFPALEALSVAGVFGDKTYLVVLRGNSDIRGTGGLLSVVGCIQYAMDTSQTALLLQPHYQSNKRLCPSIGPRVSPSLT